jgi:hypothetical protein
MFDCRPEIFDLLLDLCSIFFFDFRFFFGIMHLLSVDPSGPGKQVRQTQSCSDRKRPPACPLFTYSIISLS